MGAVAAEAAPWPAAEPDAARRVTLLWLVIGAVLFLVLALAGLTVRLSQAVQDLLPPRVLYALLTFHGTGMVGVALTVTAAVFWYVMSRALPLSPAVMRAVLGLTLGGVVLIVLSTLFGFGTGWTFLHPLPQTPGPTPGWPRWTAGTFLVGLALVVVAFTLWCLDYLRAGISRFGSLGRMLGFDILLGRREPGPDTTDPSVIAGTVVSIGGLAAAVPGALVVGLMLANLAAPGFSVNALLAKNLIFFAGHMLVNVQIYLGAGLAYAILPEYAGRPWKASRVLVLAWLVTSVFVMIAFFHHLYQDFAQPLAAQVIGQVGSYGVAFPPIVVTIFGGLLLLYRSGIRWRPAPLFVLAAFAGWAIGGWAAVIDSTPAVNQYLHNTVWVPAHFHTYMALGVVFFLVGAVYHVLPQVTGRSLSDRVGMGAAALVILGGWGLVAMWYLSGILGQPRRYAITLEGLEGTAAAAVGFAALAAVGVALMFGDFVRVVAARRRPLGPAT
ncbi:MAG TPA: cbb3-type cytochrome c oxidase subunit I [Actinomycetota bacterium]|nr:cbb3-type cytochrome c oxidase subunit I [Actinomycetota bacterium]